MKKTIPAEIESEVRRIWERHGISDHELKGISDTYVTEDGKYVLFRKPTIQTSFCYGYGQCGMSTDDDEKRAYDNCRAMHSKERFIDANVNGEFRIFDEMMKHPVIRRETTYDTPDGNLWAVRAGDSVTMDDRRRREHVELSEKDLEGIRKVLVSERDKFVKRLEAYWKRYGSSKLKVWAYLCD